jgi:CO/xanthine dehydrogenase FAD-binding subunit
MSNLSYKAPATVDELAGCLALADAGTRLLGGGTDLVIQMRDRGMTEGTLVDLTRVAGLDQVELEGDWISIGANVTYAEMAVHPLITGMVPCLAQMADQVGSLQIRNTARLPGNIANASPAGDSIATLMALDARVELLNGRGERSHRRIDQVVTGIGRTTLARDEAILAVQVPRPAATVRSRYGKIGMGPRSQVVIANVSLTLVLDFPPESGLIRDPRVVLGSAAPLAYHARKAEALLDGSRPSMALAQELAAVLRGEVEVSIKGIEMFMHKLNDVQGLALDLFANLFSDAR